MDIARFLATGWIRFSHDEAIADWARRALPVARDVLEDEAIRAKWLRCGGTWFAGVNALPNDTKGAVPGRGVPPLRGAVVDFVAEHLGLAGFAWDAAQVSVCFPSYPQPSEAESEAAFRFRRDRDAAHVDGLRRFDGRRRKLGETHGFILGLPLSDAPAEAAPFVIYEGSHKIMRKALGDRLAGIPPEKWDDEDVTEAYVAARRTVFETCRRIEIAARPGEAYLAHRLSLHGVGRWSAPARPSGTEMRMIAYFRPDPFPGVSPTWWLDRP